MQCPISLYTSHVTAIIIRWALRSAAGKRTGPARLRRPARARAAWHTARRPRASAARAGTRRSPGCRPCPKTAKTRCQPAYRQHRSLSRRADLSQLSDANTSVPSGSARAEPEQARCSMCLPHPRSSRAEQPDGPGRVLRAESSSAGRLHQTGPQPPGPVSERAGPEPPALRSAQQRQPGAWRAAGRRGARRRCTRPPASPARSPAGGRRASVAWPTPQTRRGIPARRARPCQFSQSIAPRRLHSACASTRSFSLSAERMSSSMLLTE